MSLPARHETHETHANTIPCDAAALNTAQARRMTVALTGTAGKADLPLPHQTAAPGLVMRQPGCGAPGPGA